MKKIKNKKINTFIKFNNLVLFLPIIFIGIFLFWSPVLAAEKCGVGTGKGMYGCKCGDEVAGNAVIKENLDCREGNGLIIEKSNITITCENNSGIIGTRKNLNPNPEESASIYGNAGIAIGPKGCEGLNNIKIEGCRLINWDIGIFLNGYSLSCEKKSGEDSNYAKSEFKDITLENNVIMNSVTGISTGANLYQTKGLKIKNNDILEADAYGMYLRGLAENNPGGTKDNSISGNRITILSPTINGEQAGIMLVDPRGVEITNNLFYMPGMLWYGVYYDENEWMDTKKALKITNILVEGQGKFYLNKIENVAIYGNNFAQTNIKIYGATSNNPDIANDIINKIEWCKQGEDNNTTFWLNKEYPGNICSGSCNSGNIHTPCHKECYNVADGQNITVDKNIELCDIFNSHQSPLPEQVPEPALIKPDFVNFTNQDNVSLFCGRNSLHTQNNYQSVLIFNSNRVSLIGCTMHNDDENKSGKIGVKIDNSTEVLMRTTYIDSYSKYYLDVSGNASKYFNHQIYNVYASQPILQSTNYIRSSYSKTAGIVYIYKEDENSIPLNLNFSDSPVGHLSVIDSKNLEIFNVQISGGQDNFDGSRAGDPIKIINSSGIALKNSRVSNTIGGLYAENCDNLQIKNLESSKNYYTGGKFWNVGTSMVSDSTFKETKLYPDEKDNSGYGFYLAKDKPEDLGDKNVFLNNIIKDNQGGGMAIYLSNNNKIYGDGISSSVISLNGYGDDSSYYYSGLLLSNSDNNLIYGVDINQNKLNNVYIANSSIGNLLYNNNIKNSNAGRGVYLSNSTAYLGYQGTEAPVAHHPDWTSPYETEGKNSIENNHLEGVYLANSNNSHLFENTITLNIGDGIKGSKSKNVILKNNEIEIGKGGYGINILDSSDWRLNSNSIKESSDYFVRSPFLHVGIDLNTTPKFEYYKHYIASDNIAGGLPIYYYYENKLGNLGSQVYELDGLSTNHLQIANSIGFKVSNLRLSGADPLELDYIRPGLAPASKTQVASSTFFDCRDHCLYLYEVKGSHNNFNNFNNLKIGNFDLNHQINKTGIFIKNSEYNDFDSILPFFANDEEQVQVNAGNYFENGLMYLFNSDNNIIQNSTFAYRPSSTIPIHPWDIEELKGELYFEGDQAQKSSGNIIKGNTFMMTGAFEGEYVSDFRENPDLNYWCEEPLNDFSKILLNPQLSMPNWNDVPLIEDLHGGIPNGALKCLPAILEIKEINQVKTDRSYNLEQRRENRGIFEVVGKFAHLGGESLRGGMFIGNNSVPIITDITNTTYGDLPGVGSEAEGAYRIGTASEPIEVKFSLDLLPNYTEVTFKWNALSGNDGIDNSAGNYSLKLGAIDRGDRESKSPRIFTFIDLLPPILSSFNLKSVKTEVNGSKTYEFSWHQASERNWERGIAHYEIWYGADKDEVYNREDNSSASGPYVLADLADIPSNPFQNWVESGKYNTSLAIQTTTGVSLNTKTNPQYFMLCAIDNYGNESCIKGPTSEVAPWVQTLNSNIYSGGDIGSANYKTSGPSATYLIQANGIITGWYSDMGEAPSGWKDNWPITNFEKYLLPSPNNQFTSILGSLDYLNESDLNKTITHLKKLYGASNVVDYSSGQFNNKKMLGGKIYYNNGNLIINKEVQFSSGTGSNDDGSGLIIVKGNLTINKNLTYDSNSSATSLKNVASVGFIVLGDIFIDSSVTELVGAFVALGDGKSPTCPSDLKIASAGCGRIITGNSDRQLVVKGLMVAKQFYFQRTYKDVTEGSEKIIYDGRIMVNPPKGMEDITKALPVWK